MAKTYLGLLHSTGAGGGDPVFTYDFTAAEDGLFVGLFEVRGSTARTVSSVTVQGGGAVTPIVTNVSDTRKYAIVAKVVTAGAVQVIATLSGTNGTSAFNMCAGWLLTNYVSATPTDFANLASASATSLVPTLDIAANGVALFAASHQNANLHTWSTAAELDDETNGAGATTAADLASGPGESNHAETVSWTTAASCMALAVSFALNSTINYSITADPGSFTLTGVAAVLNKTLSIIAGVGAFVLTGIAVGFGTVFSMVAGTGSFAVTGVTAGLKRARLMAADTAAFVLDGISIAFTNFRARRSSRVSAKASIHTATAVLRRLRSQLPTLLK